MPAVCITKIIPLYDHLQLLQFIHSAHHIRCQLQETDVVRADAHVHKAGALAVRSLTYQPALNNCMLLAHEKLNLTFLVITIHIFLLNYFKLVW
jgi:hypothetical protein